MRRSFSLILSLIVIGLAPVGLSADELTEPVVSDAEREHWAFLPLARPVVPDVENTSWPRNAVDRFILRRMEEDGAGPWPEADRLTLLRRVTFDLTGLPPKPEDSDAFLADDLPGAYERVVDRLLASDDYGPRWAQHWLDVARFAETDGFEHDYLRPHAWKYRDWVIAAFNADMPFDRFVRWQIAGDEIEPDDPAAAVATGFLLCGPDMPDINSQDERRHTVLNEMTATVGEVFLGLQVGCAQCHHHKFDPISQHDFYQLRACFTNAEIFQDHPLPGSGSPQSPLGRVMHESSAQAKPAFLMLRGDFDRPGPQVAPGFPDIANPDGHTVPAPRSGAHTSGRRKALAEWLTRPDNALFCRVAANRLWQRHFGVGLCATPGDFGVMGEMPTHPELLDWLATELPRQGWSLKRMHRLIVTSAAYRQGSGGRSQESGGSPNDSSFRSPHRLEGEAIRDALLFVSGRLSRRRGGAGVRPPLPPELVGTLLRGQWEVTADGRDHRRRSVYLFVRRNLQYPLLAVFDKPDTNATCACRGRSTIAPQALTLLNSELPVEAAADLAARVLREAGLDRAAQVERCYLHALGRPPDAAERKLAIAFLEAAAARAGGSSQTALADFCLALFNLNEFVYVD
jgi:hypothetical protein